MKILQIITELRSAGAERIVLELCKGLIEKNNQVAVVSLLSLPKNSNIITELKQYNIRVYSLNLTKSTPWRIFSLYTILHKEQPRIIHSHLIHPNIITRLLLSFQKKYKLINSVHITEERPGKKWYFVLDALTYRMCDVMTAVSKSVQIYHSQKIGVPADRMAVVYNGVKTPTALDFKQITSKRHEWGVHSCSKIIGSVGRLHYQKGYDLFLNILPRLSLSIPKNEIWGIVILGEGEEREFLQSLCLSIPENIIVKFPGFFPDAANLIAAFDLFIMPSRSEGFGLTLAEAMSHGVPTIVNNIDVLVEIMGSYDNGALVDFNNHEQAIAKTLEYIHRKKSLPYIKFSIQKMIDDYIDVYQM